MLRDKQIHALTPVKIIESSLVKHVYTTNALFRDGKFVTHAIQSDKKFLALAGVGVKD